MRLIVITSDHQDATGPNQDHNWKRGDVVDIMEDGESPGKAIENNPGFRIVEVPGVPAAKYKVITTQETQPLPDPLDPKSVQTVRKRQYKLDIDAAEASKKPADNKVPLTIAEGELLTLYASKPELVSDEIETPK